MEGFAETSHRVLQGDKEVFQSALNAYEFLYQTIPMCLGVSTPTSNAPDADGVSYNVIQF